jgi:catechol 2,3-dioxygenase-like lactoylglutathione lyase family enzyme
MIKYHGIHHLAMATRDMDQTIRFWRDLLEMRLVIGMGRPGYRHYFFEVSPDTLLTFFEWPDVEPVLEKDHGYPVKGPFVFDHVSFAVDSEETVWMLRDRLDAAGYWVSDMIDHGFIRSVYAFDPNGIPIEFSCAVAGFDIRKNPVNIDSHLSQIIEEGPEPQPGKWPPVERSTPPEERDIFPGEGLELFDGIKKNIWEKALKTP